MKLLAIALRELRIAYYTRALSEIHPLHPDVPHIVRTLQQLRDQRAVRPTWSWT